MDTRYKRTKALPSCLRQPPRCSARRCYWVLLLCSLWGKSGRSTGCLVHALCSLSSRAHKQQSLCLEHRWFSDTWLLLRSFCINKMSSDSSKRPVPCCQSKLPLSPNLTLEDTDEAAEQNAFSSSLRQECHISKGNLISLGRGLKHVPARKGTALWHSRLVSLWGACSRVRYLVFHK